MKGVNKRVIEIVEPQSEHIERVLVFFKEGDGNIKLAQQKSEAESFVKSLVCWRKNSLPMPKGAMAYLMCGMIGLAVGILCMLFF